MAFNINIKSSVQRLFTKELIESFKCYELKNWIKKITNFKDELFETRMHDKKIVTINEIPIEYRHLILSHFNQTQNIKSATVVSFNGLKLTSRKKTISQNFSITYSNNETNLNYGIVVNFYEFNDNLYAIVQRLTKTKCFAQGKNIDDRLENFFFNK